MAPNATYAACASMLLAAPVYARGMPVDVAVALPCTVALVVMGKGLAEPYVYAPPETGRLHVAAEVVEEYALAVRVVEELEG